MDPELFHPLIRADSFFSLNCSMLSAMDFQRKSFCRTWRSGAVRSLSVSMVFPFLVVMITMVMGRHSSQNSGLAEEKNPLMEARVDLGYGFSDAPAAILEAEMQRFC